MSFSSNLIIHQDLFIILTDCVIWQSDSGKMTHTLYHLNHESDMSVQLRWATNLVQHAKIKVRPDDVRSDGRRTFRIDHALKATLPQYSVPICLAAWDVIPVRKMWGAGRCTTGWDRLLHSP